LEARADYLADHEDLDGAKAAHRHGQVEPFVKATHCRAEGTRKVLVSGTGYRDNADTGNGDGAFSGDEGSDIDIHLAPSANLDLVAWAHDVVGGRRQVVGRCEGTGGGGE
jgi:hypothetical protein